MNRVQRDRRHRLPRRRPVRAAGPVRLTGVRSVRIRGQGAATVLAPPGPRFSIENSFAVAVENLAIISLGKQPVISVRSGSASRCTSS